MLKTRTPLTKTFLIIFFVFYLCLLSVKLSLISDGKVFFIGFKSCLAADKAPLVKINEEDFDDSIILLHYDMKLEKEKYYYHEVVRSNENIYLSKIKNSKILTKKIGTLKNIKDDNRNNRFITPDKNMVYLTEENLNYGYGKITINKYNLISGKYYIFKHGSSLFTIDCITDYKVLLESLKSPKHPGKQRIWEFLNQKCKDKIENLNPAKPIDLPLIESIIAGFNEILNRVDFYNPDVFKNIELTEEGKSLYKKGLEKLEKSDLQRFNRLLFESIYPHEIAKSLKHLKIYGNANFANCEIFNSFSNSGKKLLCFMAGIKCDERYNSFVVYRIKGNKALKFRNILSNYNYRPSNFSPPKISPDGKLINIHIGMFPSKKMISILDIVIIGVDEKIKPIIIRTNREQTDLYMHDTYNVEKWSPDSKKILFIKRNLKGDALITTADITTNKQKCILKVKDAFKNWDKIKPKVLEPCMARLSPDWIPEMEWTEKGILITCKDAIYLRLNKDNKTRKLEIPVKVEKFYNGRLSPDGKRVLFLGAEKGQSNIYVYNVNTNKLIKSKLPVVNYVLEEYQAAWVNPSGNSFLSNQETSRVLYKTSKKFITPFDEMKKKPIEKKNR